MTTKHRRFALALPSTTFKWLLVLLWFEALAVAAYLFATPVRVEQLRYVLYPFVWINVGLLAVLVTNPPTATWRARLVAGGLAVAYFLVLGSLAGMLSVNFDALLGSAAHAAGHHQTGWQFTLGAPGWGPRVGYAGEAFSVMLVPYHVVGYLALSYLVYATILDTARAAVPGVLGLVSCVGCAFPLAGSLAAGAAGGTGLVSSLRILSVDLSTVVFVVAVAVLVFRPTATGER
ncbi:hypothetical protein ACFQJC_07965 [Haloferax namakaokahaiae]|uniref:Uncharacterized protein n=1 Tax=Haloferax namakaokahaiae TaxID=1748331 RepID=A0ABD5ZEA5_9EURY